MADNTSNQSNDDNTVRMRPGDTGQTIAVGGDGKVNPKNKMPQTAGRVPIRMPNRRRKKSIGMRILKGALLASGITGGALGSLGLLF